MRNKIAFVCTGNTCRSPMAEALFNHGAAQRGLKTRAISCGIAVGRPWPATPEAQQAVQDYGADLSGHLSQPAAEALLEECGRIYCMTGAHVLAMREAFPDLADRIEALSGRDIADPFGGAQADYDRTAAQIWQAVSALLEEAS